MHRCPPFNEDLFDLGKIAEKEAKSDYDPGQDSGVNWDDDEGEDSEQEMQHKSISKILPKDERTQPQKEYDLVVSKLGGQS